MKDSRFWRGFIYFFAGVGIILTLGIFLILATNIAGLGNLLSVLGIIKNQSLYDLDTSHLAQSVTEGVIDSLNDPYAEYMDPENWENTKIRLQATFGGIGVYFIQDNEGKLIIVAPIEKSPAYYAGIQQGDVIVRINGESTSDMSQDEASHLIKGDPGTQVILGLYRETEDHEIDIKIVREIISLPSVEYRAENGFPEIGYVRLYEFNSQSPREIREAINSMVQESDIQGLILDLRDNRGGDFNAAIEIADIFLDGETIVSVVNNKEQERTISASAGSINLPLVVLVNEYSASSSEVLAGALKDNKRALLVGETTYGKGVVQTLFPLRDGGAFKITTQKYYTPSGYDLSEVGIYPDYFLNNEPGENIDAQLQKALEVVKEQIF